MRRILPVVAMLAVGLCAQVVSVNGSTTFASVPLGGNLSVSLSATAGAAHWWAFSTNPGPIMLGTQAIPVGFGSTFIEVGFGLPLPWNGVRTENVFLPIAPIYSPALWYTAALVASPTAPMGFAISNGVSFRFDDPFTNAGADGATLINEPLSLDGSATRDPNTGQLVPGTALQWIINSAPFGSIATLTNATSEFPTFQTNMPGTYGILLQTQGPNGFGEDTCSVRVWNLSFSALPGGWFSNVPVNVTGVLSGPVPTAFTMNGVAPTLVGSGFFSGYVTPANTLKTLTARVEGPNGEFVTRSTCITQGYGMPVGTWVSGGEVSRLTSTGLDGFEPTIRTQLAGLDLNAMVQVLPNVQAVNAWPAATATVNPYAGSFNTTNVGFDWWPTAAGIDFSMTLHNVVMQSTVYGEIFWINYSENATITASSAVLTGRITIAPGANNTITTSITNLNATLNGFNYSMGGVLNTITQLWLIQDAIRSGVESAIEGLGPSLPGYIDPLLASLTLTSNLNQYGIPMIVEFPIQSVTHDATGGTLSNLFRATTTATSPSSGAFTKYRGTTSAAPSFPATTPSGGVYDFGIAFNDDVLNQLLLQMVRSGTLDMDVIGSVGTAPNNMVLTAQVLDLLVPGAGLGWFPPNANARLRIRHIAAPCIVLGIGGQGTLHLSGMEMDVAVEVGPGNFTPVFVASISGTCGVTMTINTTTNTLQLSVLGPTLQLTPTMRRCFPGTDPTAGLIGLAQVMQFLLPTMLDPMGQIPVPTTPIGAPTVLSVGSFIGAPDYLAAFIDF